MSLLWREAEDIVRVSSISKFISLSKCPLTIDPARNGAVDLRDFFLGRRDISEFLL